MTCMHIMLLAQGLQHPVVMGTPKEALYDKGLYKAMLQELKVVCTKGLG